ncbi:MAG TPA: response regulator [Lacunisphaera sp.]|nr:response regulator [Lacunisphaera sp.]
MEPSTLKILPPAEETRLVPDAAAPVTVNILIVDDEVRNLDVLESILYQPGYRLVRATSADEALLALVDGDFAVLVLDINMPVMNGIELANLIKQRKRNQHIPILFLTAYYQDEKFVLEGYGVGAVDYLTKPVNPQILRAKVAVFVDLHRMHLALAAGHAALEREVAQRHLAEQSLQLANQGLESRVQQRTLELSLANAALKSSESQLRLVADHASIFLAHIDRHHRFKFVNRSYAARFGLDPEDVVGASLNRIIGEAAYAACRPFLERALGGERVEFETELSDEQTGAHWMHIVYEPERSRANEVSGVVAVMADTTTRKRAEAQMMAARDEAMAASRAKDEFLAALSHELRTPLNPVLLIASAAAGNQDLAPEVREDFAIIAKNALLEARLIDDLLDLTRITRGKLALDLKPGDVHAVLDDAIATMRAELQEKNITLVVERGVSNHWAMIDSARLQQVFWNVLKNALKFTPERGFIRVETRELSETNEMTVTITDTGIGMTADELSRAFHPFTQGDHATGSKRHRFGGLGLGLAISQLLMQLHSGSVQAFSPGRNRGCTVVIQIPQVMRQPSTPAAGERLAETAPPFPAPVVAESKHPLPLPILIVEDHEATRQVLEKLFRQREYRVVTAGSVAEALLRAAEEKFEFVVSDLGLPDGTGYDLMVTLRERHGLTGIALSGYGAEQDTARSREAGFVEHLTKPVTYAMLDKVIRRLRAAAG